MHKTNSRYVVRLIGVCVPPDPYAIVLEYMEGGNLGKYIYTAEYSSRTIEGIHDNVNLINELRVSERVNYMLEIAIGMLQLHEQGIAHRDLKPFNILLTDDKRHCKVFSKFEKFENEAHKLIFTLDS